MKVITPNEKYQMLKVTDFVELECKLCHSIFTREKREVQKVIKHNNNDGYKKKWLSYCGYSCRSKFYQSHKTDGDNRSKLERWIEIQLGLLYPNLEIHYSKRDAINAELDIYIPSLRLAFELNGIFHYEPIYGEARLKSAQSNDKRKFQACLENNIELCIIDTSSVHRFTSNRGKEFLKIITNILNAKLAGCAGNAPA